MGYREVTMLEVKEVLRRWLAGAGKKTIAAQLALDVKAVRRYLGAGQKCGLQPGAGPLTEVQLAQVIAALQTLAGRPHGDSCRCT